MQRFEISHRVRPTSPRSGYEWSRLVFAYPLSGYPDLSVNFMAAKTPDILK